MELKVASSYYKFLESFAESIESAFCSAYASVRHSPPYNFFAFYLILAIILWRISSKICCNSGIKPRIYKDTSESLVQFIDQSSKEVKDMLTNSKPRVPQVNYNAMAIPRKVDDFLFKLKEIEGMHSYFQADILDSHINIFKILNNTSVKDYLRLPERELVEPDSALPPLDDQEIEI